MKGGGCNRYLGNAQIDPAFFKLGLPLDGRRLEDILHFGQIQLSDQGWESYAKIRRLAWVKSLTITLLKEGLDDSADIVQSVIEHFTRTEERGGANIQS